MLIFTCHFQVRTTLGPRGMDKLIVNSQGNATISNDGATILQMLDIVHPAAKTLVDIAKSQDAEVHLLYEFHTLFHTFFQCCFHINIGFRLETVPRLWCFSQEKYCNSSDPSSKMEYTLEL